jgi:hypothetical protein
MIESIEQKDVEFLVSTGKLKYSMPASLSKAEKITSIKRMEEIVDENCDDADGIEFFTYWEKNKPLFDIIMEKDCFSNNIKFELSNCSLFGMYWLVGNTSHVGMENAVRHYQLDVPLKVDLLKYTQMNYKKVMLEKDFKK